MAEISVADVVQFTKGRLTDDGPTGETQRMLDAALAAARHHVGWHVSPVRADDLTLDGPWSSTLALPTRKLLALTSVTEDGSSVDIGDLSWSESGLVRKRYGSWTCEYRGVAVSISHGYTEAEAADWRQAILTLVNQMAQSADQSGSGELIRKRVDDVEYQWSDSGLQSAANKLLYTVDSILSKYCLPTTGFA